MMCDPLISIFGSGRAFPHRLTNRALTLPSFSLSSIHEGYSRSGARNVRSHRPRKSFSDAPDFCADARQRLPADVKTIAIATVKTTRFIFTTHPIDLIIADASSQ